MMVTGWELLVGAMVALVACGGITWLARKGWWG